MDENTTSTRAAKRKIYRDDHEQRKRKRYADYAEGKVDIECIRDVIFFSDNIDMKTFSGTELELRIAMEKLYANDGRDFNPKLDYPPTMLYKYGSDYALHAQGIYYRYSLSDDFVTCNREIWLPSLSKKDKRGRKSEDTRDWKSRAEVFAKHSRNNERWCKSEYAWEADAWSDVFRPMRDDDCLEIDKHAYQTLLPTTDEINYKLTGESSFAKRISDATFGLATFTERDSELPSWTPDLLWENLERPNYGLVSDPSRTETNLVFPFMVYEAKGWSGDCRVARRQACSAAAFYLDMLDELARKPGPVGTPRPYQTPTSHHYQVFALTSFGAYWHLLVGYRRPRLAAEHAGETGMSETVYMFQRIWSGHVTDKEVAYELLDLIDQIQLWAITSHRTFVQDHLRPWNSLCEENYLLEWDSKYDLGEDRKRKRTCTYSSETKEDLRTPSWVNDMSAPSRQRFQDRAKLSLDEAIEEQRLIKGKFAARDNASCSEWHCVRDGCTTTCGSDTAFINHLKVSHGLKDRVVAGFKWCLKRERIMKSIRRRQKRGVMATGHRSFVPLDDKMDFEFEDVVSYDRLRLKRQSVAKRLRLVPETKD